MKKLSFGLVCAGIAVFAFSVSGFCEPYTCEVMSVSGQAWVLAENGKRPLAQGDILKIGDTVEVSKDAYVDLAYDNGWNNLTRIGEDSVVKINAIYPTGLYMEKGDIFAKLRRLPSQSTFEIETPAAVAAVRGSEYRTVHRDGETSVYNLHDSLVEVHGKYADGTMMEDGVKLKENERTEIDRLGETPHEPREMTGDELNAQRGASADLQSESQKRLGEGDEGRTQNLDKVEVDFKREVSEIVREPVTHRDNKDFSEAVGERLQEKIRSAEEKIDKQKENVEKNSETGSRTNDDPTKTPNRTVN